MKSLYDFIVKPIGDKYNNEIKVGDKKHRLENIKKIVSGSNIYSLNKINSLYKNVNDNIFK